jgi:hypothetical protein
MEEEQWLWPQCEKLHKVLVDHMVQHELYFLTNVAANLTLLSHEPARKFNDDLGHG